MLLAEMIEIKVVILALACIFMSLVVFIASLVWWDCIWRSCENHMANIGMKEKSIQALPSIIYGESIQQLPGITIANDCPICLAEFVEGEAVKVLPCCNHGFHMECIRKWLRSHSTCPACRRCLLLCSYRKLANSNQRSNSNPDEGQNHQPGTSQESRGVFDTESGVRP